MNSELKRLPACTEKEAVHNRINASTSYSRFYIHALSLHFSGLPKLLTHMFFSVPRAMEEVKRKKKQTNKQQQGT